MRPASLTPQQKLTQLHNGDKVADDGADQVRNMQHTQPERDGVGDGGSDGSDLVKTPTDQNQKIGLIGVGKIDSSP